MKKNRSNQKPSSAKKVIVIVGLLVLSFISVRGVVTMGAKYLQAKKLQSLHTTELEGLTEQKSYLQSQLDGLATEEGIDYFVRDLYPLAKEGERVINIVE